MRLPLTLSVAGHAACLALLVFFLSGKVLPVVEPIAKGGIEVVFQPALPITETIPVLAPALQPETPPADVVPPPEPQKATVPPVSEAPAVLSQPSPVSEAPVTAEAPTPAPPAHKPMVRKPPKPVQRREEPPQTSQAYLPAPPAPPARATPRALAAPTAPMQSPAAAMPVPAPVPAPEVSAGYRALLNAWLESHKRYPDSARQRGEQGNAVLRFAVDRSGRVVDYAVTKSSGYPDLDESIEQMMRGATLPPFPAGMPQTRMEVSVTVRFSLRR